MKDSNKRVRNIVIFIIGIPLCFYVLPKAVFYWSVCNGIQDSGGLVGDFLFVEYCPSETVEEWYESLFWEECVKQDQQIPPNTELLISACTYPIVRGVPGGELLFVHEKKTAEKYLLDLRTREKRQLPSDFGGTFLSSELVWLQGSSVGPGKNGYSPPYVLDLADGQKYELIDLKWEAIAGYLDNGEPNPIIVNYLTEAEQVFIHPTHNRLIMLAPNFREQTGKSVITPLYRFNLKESEIRVSFEVVEKLLRELEVDYEVIDFSLRYVEVPSPTGKYVARNDGIYYVGTDTQLAGTRGIDMNAFTSWYDERSIMLALGEYYYADMFWGKSFLLPRPVLKLNLPVP